MTMLSLVAMRVRTPKFTFEIPVFDGEKGESQRLRRAPESRDVYLHDVTFRRVVCVFQVGDAGELPVAGFWYTFGDRWPDAPLNL